MPAPTKFQNATAMKLLMAQRYFLIHSLLPFSFRLSYASKPISTNGTTSKALKVAPSAMTAVECR